MSILDTLKSILPGATDKQKKELRKNWKDAAPTDIDPNPAAQAKVKKGGNELQGASEAESIASEQGGKWTRETSKVPPSEIAIQKRVDEASVTGSSAPFQMDKRDLDVAPKYQDYFSKQGKPQDNKVNMAPVAPTNLDPQDQSGYEPMPQNFQLPESRFKGGGENAIDDGTNDEYRHSSNFATVEEMRNQADYFDLPEMKKALDQFEDKDVVSKDDFRQYGYTPYVDTSNPVNYVRDKAGQTATNLSEASEDFWRGVGNARTNITNWDEKDSEGTTYYGKTVDEAINKLTHDFDPQKGKGAAFYDVNNKRIGGADVLNQLGEIGETVESEDNPKNFIWKLPDGTEYELPQSLTEMTEGQTWNQYVTYKIDPITVEDKEGNKHELEFEEWSTMTTDPNAISLIATNDPEFAGMDQEEAEEEIRERNTKNAYYGPLNLRAPSYESGDLLSDRFFPSMLDVASQSAAYFFPQTIAERAVTQGGLAAQGMDTQTADVSDEGIHSYRPTRDQATSIVGSAVAPVAESKLGSLGAGKGREGFLEELARGAITKGKESITGTSYLPKFVRENVPEAISEGLEEIITDPMYNAMTVGATNLYANPARNEHGQLDTDEYGRLIYSTDDSPAERMNGDFWKDQANNFIGGAALGAVLPPIMRRGSHFANRDMKDVLADQRARDKELYDFWKENKEFDYDMAKKQFRQIHGR